jgi:putative peptidoglycan lipid II flippase
MRARDSFELGGGFWATGLGTLASRVLGLARDVVTASLLGLGEGGIMDALAVAFRLANLPRRIFGEGALATSFLPVFTDEWNREPRRGGQLLSALFAWLTIVLGLFVLVGEAVCWVVWRDEGLDEASRQLAALTATMLPYAVFICLAAQASAALQALFEFRWPAAVPSLLNVCWLAAAWLVAPRFAGDRVAQAHVIAVAVVVAGVLQWVVQLPALGRLGFRFDYDWAASRDAFWKVVRAMAPISVGMAATQINTLADSLIAWFFSAEATASPTVPWLPGVAYPMQSGAAAAIYYGERFYQFPVAMLGAAVATVLYPLLSRHAARGDRAEIGADLSMGLGLVWFTALPAGVGMILVAPSLVPLLFEHGAFTSEDAARASRMIACYASGVWAYSAIPVLARGFYAAGDRVTPARIGVFVVVVDLAMNLTLIWPLAERGLAVSTSIAAALQVVLLARAFSRSLSPLAWAPLRDTLTKGAVSTAVMSGAVLAVQLAWPPVEARSALALQVASAITAGIAAYLATAWLLSIRELRMLSR